MVQYIYLIGSAMRSTTQLQDYVRREADELGIDLESVKVVETDDDSTVIRVLLKDGDVESDQVGFQVSRPNVDAGRNMFNRRVANGLRELRKRIRDEESDDDSETEPKETGDLPTEKEDHDSTASEAVSVGDSSTPTDSVNGDLSVHVELSEESRSELIDQFTSIKQDIGETTASTDDLQTLEERIDDVDARLKAIEDALSLFASD